MASEKLPVPHVDSQGRRVAGGMGRNDSCRVRPHALDFLKLDHQIVVRYSCQTRTFRLEELRIPSDELSAVSQSVLEPKLIFGNLVDLLRCKEASQRDAREVDERSVVAQEVAHHLHRATNRRIL